VNNSSWIGIHYYAIFTLVKFQFVHSELQNIFLQIYFVSVTCKLVSILDKFYYCLYLYLFLSASVQLYIFVVVIHYHELLMLCVISMLLYGSFQYWTSILDCIFLSNLEYVSATFILFINFG
jgi:hypothetical protein